MSERLTDPEPAVLDADLWEGPWRLSEAELRLHAMDGLLQKEALFSEAGE